MIPGQFSFKNPRSARNVKKLCVFFFFYLPLATTVFTLSSLFSCVFSAAAEQTAYELECMKIFALAAYFVCSGKPLIVSSFYLGPWRDVYFACI